MTIMTAWLLKLVLNPKTWIYAAGLAVIVYLGHLGYSWIYDRGHVKGYEKRTAETTKEIGELTTQRNEAVRKYNEYKGQYDNWVKNTKEAQEKYLAQQQADLDARAARLAEAERSARNKPTTIKEVIKYVPAQVDASYRLPVGFVRLYSESIQVQPAATDPITGLPQSHQFDVGEASGITMSQFGQIAAGNNAECVLRGKVIEEWQGWYNTNMPLFEAIRKWQLENGPKPEGDLTPPPG
jgi:hypothetical protein